MLCFRKFLVAKKFMDKKKGEESRFRLKFFLSQCRKRPYVNPLIFHQFRVSKKLMIQSVMSRFSVGNFSSHSIETFCRGTRNPSVLCFRKFVVAKMVINRNGGGVSKFLVEKFLSHSAEKFPRGNRFCLSIFSSIERIYASEGYVTIFRRTFFCLTLPKHFIEEPFCGCFRNFLVAKQFMDKKWEGKYRNFPSKMFCLEKPKNFVGEPFSLSIFSGIEKYYSSEGYVTFFRRKLFVSQS